MSDQPKDVTEFFAAGVTDAALLATIRELPDTALLQGGPGDPDPPLHTEADRPGEAVREDEEEEVVEKPNASANGTGPEVTPEARPQLLPLTDAGNALRFCQQHGRDLFIVAERGWFAWDGKLFRPTDPVALIPRAMRTVEVMLREVNAMPNDTDEDRERRKTFLKWVTASHGAQRLHAMITLAAGFLRVPAETLDADPALLCCANGVVDLRDGSLRPHDRADRMTRMAPADYDPGARDPKWTAFLERLFGADPAYGAWLQRAAGYSLAGTAREECLFFVFGLANGGKTTFLEALGQTLGTYGLATPFATVLENRTDGPSNDLARLDGARFVRAAESADGKRLAVAKVKSITGGDTQSARFLHKEFFDFVPVFKLWLASNFKPVVQGDDSGLWRRMRVLPFNVVVPEAERDPTLKTYLTTAPEARAAILAWAVAGAQRWYRDGLGWCTAVREATESYRTESDTFGEFLADACDLADPRETTLFHELFMQYTRWCESRRERPWSAKRFAMQLTSRGVAPTAIGDVAARSGIRLRTTDSNDGRWRDYP